MGETLTSMATILHKLKVRLRNSKNLQLLGKVDGNHLVSASLKLFPPGQAVWQSGSGRG